ncbi:MAG: hypothetical protein ACRC5M_04935 [Anaeroplasmataceae bacterium]
MNSQRIGVWPATGVAPGILDLEKNFGNMILTKFPAGFINTWHFDDKMNIKNSYKNTKVNIVANSDTQAYTKQKRPRLTVIFNNSNASQPDADGGDEFLHTYPLVQGVHPEMNGYIPIYKDPNNIAIYMSHKRIRVNFNALVEVESMADQESALNMIENIFKMQYGSFMEGVPARFVLPNDMINTIYKVLYAEEINSIPKMESEEEKEKIFEDIGQDFYKLLKKYSSCNGITQYNRKNNPKDNYFLYRQIYSKLYYQITSRPEKTDGDRIGSIYSKYTITFDGFLEFEKPVSYILSMPDVVAGNSVSNALRTSGNISYFRDHIPPGYMKYFGRRERMPLQVAMELKNDFMKVIYHESDITLDEKDIIDLPQWMADIDVENKKLKIYAAFMKTLGKDNFDDYFKVFIHNINDNAPVSEDDMLWDGEVLHVAGIDTTSLYKIYVLADKMKLNHKLLLELKK